MRSANPYHPSDDQRSLIAAFDRPIQEVLPLGRLHERFHESQETWQSLADLGLFGINAAEEQGGAGLGCAELVLLAERLGRQLAAPSVFATLAAAQAGLAEPAVRRMLAGEIRTGAAQLAGMEALMIDCADKNTTFVLIRDEDGASIAPRDALSHVVPTEDVHWAVDLARAKAVTGAGQRLREDALTRLRLIDAAALCGVAGAARDMSVSYAKIREQFGRPIGSFQAVKHCCADMEMAAVAARDLLTFSAVAVDQRREDAAFHVETALLLAMDAALRNTRANIQIHGGIGFSDEADPHLLLKRAHVYTALAGRVENILQRCFKLQLAV